MRMSNSSRNVIGDNPQFIFLDIDGVLNAADVDGEIWYKDYGFIHKELVDKLDSFCERTGAFIVCTSVWRKTFSPDEIQEMLEYFGAKHCKVVSNTPIINDPYFLRGNEIRMWIKETGYINEHSNDYIILDDESDMLIWQQDNFFRVDGRYGLSDDILVEAEWFLREGKNE